MRGAGVYSTEYFPGAGERTVFRAFAELVPNLVPWAMVGSRVDAPGNGWGHFRISKSIKAAARLESGEAFPLLSFFTKSLHIPLPSHHVLQPATLKLLSFQAFYKQPSSPLDLSASCSRLIDPPTQGFLREGTFDLSTTKTTKY
jgi:hypothetical protein